MKEIYGIGESVLDIIFKNGQPIAAKPGGSMLNSMVSLGRSNMPVNYISDFGNDKAGNLIADFLIENNVGTKYIYRYDHGKTVLATAFLDDDNNAEYDFYKIYPEKRLDIKLPDVNYGDILLFGSSFSINPNVREQLMKFVKQAKNKGCIIIYDPNYRKTNHNELAQHRTLIEENMSYADIIRGSNEDFNNIFSFSTAEETYNYLKKYCPILIYTAGRDNVEFYSSNLHKIFPVNIINPLSTIGAGDNFNAGIIHAISKCEISKNDIMHITEEKAEKIITTGISFATETCLSYDNYIQ